MAVPTTIESLSPLTASNTPSNSDQVAPDLNDYLQAIQAILRRTNAKGTNIASASTTNIGASVDGDFIDVTGTTTITSFGTVAAGVVRTVRFTGALTITHSANIILPGAVNLVTVANDIGVWRSLGGGAWICEGFSGAAQKGQANTFTQPQTISATTAAPLIINTSVASTAAVTIANTNAGNYQTALNMVGAGTGSVVIGAYNNTSGADFLGSIAWSDSTGFTLNAGGGTTAYTVSSAKRHDFTVGAGEVFAITFSSGDTLYTNNDGTHTYLYAVNAVARFGSSTNNAEIVGNNTVCGIAKSSQFDAYGGLRFAASYDASGNLVANTNTSGYLAGGVSKIATGKYRVPFTSLSGYIATATVVNTAELRIRIYAKTATYCEVWIQDYNSTTLVDSAFDVVFSF